MAQTTFSGPIRSGTVREGAAANVGNALLQQSAVINQNGTNAVSNTFLIPENSQIVDVIVDVLTAFNSATSATLTVGTAAGGTQYAGGVDAKTSGRTRPGFTAAQLAAMANVGSTQSVVATVTPSGATSAGQVRVTLVYRQN